MRHLRPFVAASLGVFDVYIGVKCVVFDVNFVRVHTYDRTIFLVK